MSARDRSPIARPPFRRTATILVSVGILLAYAGPASAGSAKKLAFGTPPANTIAGRLIPAVTVQLLDQQNRPVTDSGVQVTVALGGNDEGATLFGEKTQPTVNGVATFSSLRVNLGGSYTLIGSSPGLTSTNPATFSITGVSDVCDSSIGCKVNDPNGTKPTAGNSTTGTVQVPNCPGAGADTDFLSYDESAASFCDGSCLGAAVFFASECTTSDPWLIIYRLDKTLLGTDKGAVHIVIYIEGATPGTGTAVPACVKQGVIGSASICVSRQYKNGQGDSITEILKQPGDPRIAGKCNC